MSQRKKGERGRSRTKYQKGTTGLAMKENKQPTKQHNLKWTLKLAHLGKLCLGKGKAGSRSDQLLLIALNQ